MITVSEALEGRTQFSASSWGGAGPGVMAGAFRLTRWRLEAVAIRGERFPVPVWFRLEPGIYPRVQVPHFLEPGIYPSEPRTWNLPCYRFQGRFRVPTGSFFFFIKVGHSLSSIPKNRIILLVSWATTSGNTTLNEKELTGQQFPDQLESSILIKPYKVMHYQFFQCCTSAIFSIISMRKEERQKLGVNCRVSNTKSKKS